VILVDTSIWVDHLRNNDPTLQGLLNRAGVVSHPFVIGEIALGHLRQRAVVLSLLDQLPAASVAADHEVLLLIEANRLFGTGLGYVDAHLIASARLTPGTLIWTRDKQLNGVLPAMGLAATPQSLASP
jgi:hypothetical protein